MTTPTVLVATWSDGLFVVVGEIRGQECDDQSVRALAPDGHGGALAIVNGRSLRRRAPRGAWSTIATTEFDLACCVAVGDSIYVGTDDARVLRVGANGELEPLRGFDVVAGRETWYAGSAVINGQRVGPPLGIRSMTASPDGAILANVHVGGVPRSTDGGATWQATIDVNSDVHEVRAHPNRPGIVIAAAAIGLCTSRDGGVTWTVEQEGLHAPYCSAVAFAGDDILVSASVGHFATQGAIYRRPVDGHGPLVAVAGGLPARIDGIADTACIAARGSAVAFADRGGNVYVSADTGRSWSHLVDGIPPPSSVLLAQTRTGSARAHILTSPMILTRDVILGEIEAGRVVIEPFFADQVGPASIDLHLGDEIRVMHAGREPVLVTDAVDFRTITHVRSLETPYPLAPGETIHGITRERITLPGDIGGWLEGRSRFARLGLMIHVTSGFVQPGVSTRQVLEMSNVSGRTLLIHAGVRLLQIVLQRCEGSAIYEGRFARQDHL